MLIVGLYMTELPKSPQKLKIYGLHKATGILVLFLGIMRISWRLSHIAPALTARMPVWQRKAAHAVHFLLYAIMLMMPLTGWLISSSAGISVSFFGLFTMPDLISPNESLVEVFEEMHEFLAFTLIGLITLHVAAVVQHYVMYKENILRRMWPWSS
jgi:cytochrome b561